MLDNYRQAALLSWRPQSLDTEAPSGLALVDICEIYLGQFPADEEHKEVLGDRDHLVKSAFLDFSSRLHHYQFLGVLAARHLPDVYPDLYHHFVYCDNDGRDSRHDPGWACSA